MCYVDGSWDQEGKAGIGAYLLKNGVLISWLSKGVLADTPAQAEAKAVLQRIEILQSVDEQGLLLSDSQEIV